MRPLIRKLLKEYDRQAEFDSAYEDFEDKKLLSLILKYLNGTIKFDGGVLPGSGVPEHWEVCLVTDTFEDHLCYGCNGCYTFSTGDDVFTELAAEDNDHTTSAIAISVTELMGGEWMDYYYIIQKFLQNKIRKYMDDNAYPEMHEMDW